VLPYSHLFDVDACACFVADFVLYKPLEESAARKAPSRVTSTTRALADQTANCVEMANLLTSFLCGFGFQVREFPRPIRPARHLSLTRLTRFAAGWRPRWPRPTGAGRRANC